MITEHEKYSGQVNSRPEELPLITKDDLVKGEYTDGNGKFCYTGWLLHIFIPSDGRTQYVEAYKQFRLKTMDLMYAVADKDNMDSPEARANAFNSIAKDLSYKQIPCNEWNNKYTKENNDN